MGLLRKFFSQTRKPEGFLGKLMVNGMNSGHAKLAEWGMSSLEGIGAESIAELGCGGGGNAAKLLERYPKAKLTALDYSELSVEKTKKTNQRSVAEGRCTVLQGNVADLPFEKESFDLAMAFETVYFWPGLETCFTEVFRTLKPGGAFLICNESDGTDETALRFEQMIEGMKCYTIEQLSSALKTAGFSEVTAVHHPSKPWIALLARKEKQC
ncbi:MAG: class I SAM-dependent methyltransferase [Clostridia bacterium]|nr:class I SAM-dependent methyltransferase [Clostridia bacterium]